MGQFGLPAAPRPQIFTSPALQLTRLIPALLSSLWGSSGRDVQAEFLLNFISVG